jgi:hypothetical protein
MLECIHPFLHQWLPQRSVKNGISHSSNPFDAQVMDILECRRPSQDCRSKNRSALGPVHKDPLIIADIANQPSRVPPPPFESGFS